MLTVTTSFAVATIRSVPASYATIQSALNACAAGDTVLVQPGTYAENLVWPVTAAIKLVSAGDTTNTFIDGNANGAVITITTSMVDTNTVITGFTITNGYKTGSMANGGGIYLSNASPKFEQVAVSDNRINAANWGYGAGVHANNSSVIFSHSSISRNRTDFATWGYGGGVYLSGSGNPKFRNVRIENNFVIADIWNYGTGIYAEDVTLSLTDCLIRGNTTGDSASYSYGTGLFVQDGQADLVNVAVLNNMSSKFSSYHYGIGIHIRSCTANLTNVLVAGNLVSDGGNFYNGAGIYLTSSGGNYNRVNMMNVTVTDNKRTNSGIVNGSGLYAGSGDTISITNSIFWNPNSGAEIFIPSSGTTVLTASYSNIRNGFAGTGNINMLPGFVSASDFHLTPSSPCVNTGTLSGAPAFDLDNMPRPSPAGTNPDMGCYELSQPLNVYELTTGIFSVNVYPNPAAGLVTVAINENKTDNDFTAGYRNAEITISDLSGKKIYQQIKGLMQNGTSETGINISHLANGVYLMIVKTDNFTSVKKLAVNNQ